MLADIEKAILVAVDCLTPDGYGDCDGAEIDQELKRMGKEPPHGIWFNRTVMKLKGSGYLGGATTVASGGPVMVELTEGGREIAREDGDPFERMSSQAQRFLGAGGFAEAYPDAYGFWKDAIALLFDEGADAEASTIGHKAREGMEAFATAMIERFGADDPVSDVKRVKQRLGAVIAHNRMQMSTTERAVLEDLGNLWESVADLAQRQEHSAQREGEPLVWNDGRRLTYLAMLVMVEFATMLDEPEAGQRTAERSGRGT